MITDETDYMEERREGRHHERRSNTMLKIRNVLNAIFILLAVAGMIICVVGKWETGLHVIMISIPFKMADSAIRLLKI